MTFSVKLSSCFFFKAFTPAVFCCVVLYSVFGCTDAMEVSQKFSTNNRLPRLQQQHSFDIQGRRQQAPVLRKTKIYRSRRPVVIPRRNRGSHVRPVSVTKSVKTLSVSPRFRNNALTSKHSVYRQYNNLRRRSKNKAPVRTLLIQRFGMPPSESHRFSRDSKFLVKNRALNSSILTNRSSSNSYFHAPSQALQTRFFRGRRNDGTVAFLQPRKVSRLPIYRIYRIKQAAQASDRSKNRIDHLPPNKNESSYPALFSNHENLPFFTVHRVLPMPAKPPRFSNFSAEDLQDDEELTNATSFRNDFDNSKAGQATDLAEDSQNMNRVHKDSSETELDSFNAKQPRASSSSNSSYWWKRYLVLKSYIS